MYIAASQKSLTAKQLAKLFTLLGRLQAAGLPSAQAVAMLQHTESGLKPALRVMQRQLIAGEPISKAGHAAGIFDGTQQALLHAAESSGRLEEVYARLAKHYTALAGRMRKVQARLYLPALVLMLSLFLQPLPALFAGQISGAEYLLLSVGRLAAIGCGVYVLIELPQILQSLGCLSAWHRLQLRLPLIIAWITRRQINECMFMLALLLDAGLAFSEALPKAVAGIKNTCLRGSFAPALAMLGSGASATEILAKAPVLKASLLQVINSSEQSGRLAAGMLHFVRLEADSISLQDEALAEWLPRIVYTLLAVWMAYTILSSRMAMFIPGDI